MLVSKEQLQLVFKECPNKRIDLFLKPLNETLERYSLNTPSRIQCFLAQIGHESGQLRYVEELASGQAYEGRKDLGNTETGDGVRYKGRGLIQITGKRNYVLCGLSLDLPLLENPELLTLPTNACLSAGWYFYNNNLLPLCDKGLFRELTKRINGGYNGLDDRLKLYTRAIEVIK